ncbi:MAG: endonuclease/exonuclease/phosphatase family protein [Granulosicoccus sp.]|nr:endonuclease/exonuclease/phosphatase family protein [Granulosicoccus sp.]
MIRRHLLPHCYTADDELQRLGAAQQPALGPVIRCLVWNILKAKRASWPTDFQELVADRDLALLQEAVFNAPSDALFTDSQRLQWIMARSFRHPRTLVEHGVKTGCVAAPVEQHVYMSPHTEPVSQTQKLLLTTLYPLQGEDEQLLVLNMHAINFVSVHKYVEQLDQLSAALGPHDGPVILAGDFNTWNPARLGHFQLVAAQAGLTEAVMERQSRLAHMNQHLDHVFYRGLGLRSVESLGHYQSSDHAPITATFERRRDPI